MFTVSQEDTIHSFLPQIIYNMPLWRRKSTASYYCQAQFQIVGEKKANHVKIFAKSGNASIISYKYKLSPVNTGHSWKAFVHDLVHILNPDILAEINRIRTKSESTTFILTFLTSATLKIDQGHWNKYEQVKAQLTWGYHHAVWKILLHSGWENSSQIMDLYDFSSNIRYSKVIFQNKCLCLKMVCSCRAFDSKHNGIVVFCVT